MCFQLTIGQPLVDEPGKAFWENNSELRTEREELVCSELFVVAGES